MLLEHFLPNFFSEQIEDVTKACFLKGSYFRASQATGKGRCSSFKLPFLSFIGNKVRENKTKPFLSALVSYPMQFNRRHDNIGFT